MTGFLASLAARSIGHERVLEPRRVFFEPREEAIPDSGATTPPRAQPAPRDEGDGAPAATEQTSPDEPDVRADEKPRLAEVHAEARPRTPPQRPSATPLQPAAGRQSADPQPSPAVDAPAAPFTARPAAPQHPPPTAQAPSALPATVHVRAALAAGPSPAPRSRFRPPSTGVPAAEEQVVRITIGRVDVRAVQQPGEQPPRARPAPPRMTLAEYLARGRRS